MSKVSHPGPGRKRRRAPADENRLDWREQTYNEGESGPVEEVSTPADLITTLRAIVIDVDPANWRPRWYGPGAAAGRAERLHKLTLRGMLARHPVLRRAEVRFTGTGLHVLVKLDPFAEFRTTADRDRWAAAAAALQCLVPSDTNASGMTLHTRPVGSVNGKTWAKVATLFPGESVSPNDVLAAVELLRARPFAVVAGVLFGDPVRPCPLCGDGSLSCGPRQGRCYSCCKVELAALYEHFDATTREGVARG